MNKEELIQSLISAGYLKTPRIIEAFKNIARADFVLEEYKNEAYENYPLSIGGGQTISQPLTVAFMLELLDPKPGEKILDIGAGSGWQTVLLAYIVSQKNNQQPTTYNPQHGLVVAIERIKKLCEFAQKNIEKYKFISNGVVKFYCGDATDKKFEEAPFDKIIAAAAARPGRGSPNQSGWAANLNIPEEWKNQLKPGGKIVAPINGSIWLFQKTKEGEWHEKEFPGFAFVPLVIKNL